MLRILQRYARPSIFIIQGSYALALVRRPQLHAQDEVRLKTAAAMADSGDIREVAEKVLQSSVNEGEDLLQKV